MFHPDLNYEIVRMRHGELVARATRRKLVDRIELRRRRHHAGPDEDRPVASNRHLAVVPPPRHDGDRIGRDPQVA